MTTRPACQNVVYFYALTWLVPKLYIPSIVKTQMRLVLFSSRLVSQASNKISCKFGFQPRTTPAQKYVTQCIPVPCRVLCARP